MSSDDQQHYSEQDLQQLQIYAILSWFRDFQFQVVNPPEKREDLTNNGLVIAEILTMADQEYFQDIITKVNNARGQLDKHRVIEEYISKYYQQVFQVDVTMNGTVQSFDINGVLNNHMSSIFRMLELVICLLIKSETAQPLIELIMNYSEDVQFHLQQVIERSVPLSDGDSIQEDRYTSKSFEEQKKVISPPKSKYMREADSDEEQEHQQIGGQSQAKSFEHIELELKYQGMEKKLEELYEQLNSVERERTSLRDTMFRFEEENKSMLAQLEEVRIENQELKKHIELYEEKLTQQSTQREEKLNTHISIIKQLEQDLDNRTKRLKEIQKEKQDLESRAQEDLANLREELDLSKEKILQLQKNDVQISVYKKQLEVTASLKQDLKESQSKYQQLQDEMELLKQENQSNRKFKDVVNIMEEQLNSAQSKVGTLQKQINTLERKSSEWQVERQEMSKKLDFEKQKYEELEGNYKVLQRKCEDLEKSGGGSKHDVLLLPEKMQEELNKVKKENVLLKQELENRFDKDKLLMQFKLQDALRDKEVLEETNQSIQEQVKQLQEKLVALSAHEENGRQTTNEAQQKMLADLKKEVEKMITERDQYFMEATKQEIEKQRAQKELDKAVQEKNDLISQVQVMQGEKSELYKQLMDGKDKLVSIQAELSSLEAQKSISQKQELSLQQEIDRLRQSEKILRDEILAFKTSENSSLEKNHEMFAQLLKRQEDLQLSNQLNELKLELKDKEIKFSQSERELNLKIKELTLELSRSKEQLELYQLEIQKKEQAWLVERKQLSENGVVSKRMVQNIQREQRIMSSVFHKMGMELFKSQHFGTSDAQPAQHER